MAFSSDQLSSLFKSKHPKFIPQISSLIPTVKTSQKLWEYLSREILTPFAPKFNIYNYEKHLPKDNIKKISSIQSFSKESVQSISSFITPDIEYPKPKTIDRNYNLKLLIKTKRLTKKLKFLNERVNEDLILKKSHSINIEKEVKLSGKTITEGKFAKIRNFITSTNISVKIKPKPQTKPYLKEIFRRRSCLCQKCGTNGKLKNIHTVFVRNIVISTKKTSLSKKINSYMTSSDRFFHRNSLSFKHEGKFDGKIRSSFLVRVSSGNIKEKKSIELIKEQIYNMPLSVEPLKQVADNKGSKFFVLNQYNNKNNERNIKNVNNTTASKTYTNDNRLNILKFFRKNQTYNDEKICKSDRRNSLNYNRENKEFLNILLRNGSKKAVNLFQGQLKHFSQKIVDKKEKCPYSLYKIDKIKEYIIKKKK